MIVSSSMLLHSSEPNYTKCPKCGHRWVEEDDFFPFTLIFLVIAIFVGVIGMALSMGLDSAGLVSMFSDIENKISGYYLLACVTMVIIFIIVDIIRFARCQPDGGGE